MPKGNKQKGRANRELRGGVETRGSNPMSPGGPAGGTNSLSLAGTARPLGHSPEPPTADKAGAERQAAELALEEGRTRPSSDAAKQRARDEAHVEGSRSGFDGTGPRQIPRDVANPDGRSGND